MAAGAPSPACRDPREESVARLTPDFRPSAVCVCFVWALCSLPVGSASILQCLHLRDPSSRPTPLSYAVDTQNRYTVEREPLYCFCYLITTLRFSMHAALPRPRPWCYGADHLPIRGEQAKELGATCHKIYFERCCRFRCFSHGCAQKGRHSKSTENVNISKYMTDKG